MTLNNSFLDIFFLSKKTIKGEVIADDQRAEKCAVLFKMRRIKKQLCGKMETGNSQVTATSVLQC